MDEANSSDRRVACECGALADRMEGDLVRPHAKHFHNATG